MPLSKAQSTLTGRSLIAGETSGTGTQTFYGYQPESGAALEPAYVSATEAEIEKAVQAAVEAATVYGNTTPKERGAFLRSIADGFDAAAEKLIERAHLETALPRPRLTGEIARTSGQLRFFAGVVEEGSWVMARIDSSDAARVPPKPDVRSMLRPLGPVAVFGASNFPFAFSVAGGDTASALAAGNPVVFKAHPAHPGTGELAGQIITEAVRACGLPAGVFSLIFDNGHAAGKALAIHPGICAIGFTGSFRGGRALMDLAAARQHPIPVYAEMGSANPVFVLPGALAERSAETAKGLHGSFTLGGGQFCTKPGLVFVESSQAKEFSEQLRAATADGPAFSLLTEQIASAYRKAHEQRASLHTAEGKEAAEGFAAQSFLMETTANQYFADPALAEEIFGPSTLLVHCEDAAQMLKAAHEFEGHLTATVLGTEEDLRRNAELLQVLETKAGRLIFNAYPTGVEVCHAMVHGGPYPATSDGRSTSVGSQAIFRFTRPVAYQGMPQSVLPAALRDENPLKIRRLVNGLWSD